MDENFLVELASAGEKKFGFSIPYGMSLGDAFGNLVGTVNEVLRASSDWRDQGNLKALIVVEAMSWKEIFAQSLNAFGGEEVAQAGLDDAAADKLIAIIASGNKLMHHFFVAATKKGDSLDMYFSFRMEAGPRFISSVDFG